MRAPPERAATPRARTDSAINTRASACAGGEDSSAEESWKAEIADGSWLSGDALLRLACDAGVVVAAVDGAGGVLDVGRKRRTVPPAILRALRLRDGGCRYPGRCNRVFVEAHHIVHWAHCGATSLGRNIDLSRGISEGLHQLPRALDRAPDCSLALRSTSSARSALSQRTLE